MIEKNNIYNMDCNSGLTLIPNNSVDLVIADPPFGIKFNGKKSNYNRKSSFVIDEYNEISQENYYQFMVDWLSKCKDIIKSDGSIFTFSGWTNLGDVINAHKYLGLNVINHIVWKYQFGVFCKNKYITSHYHILWASKGKKHRHYPNAIFDKKELDKTGKKAYYADREDVWIINRDYWKDKTKTPTKLPEKLIDKIILYSTLENDFIVDPFSGSGQVAKSCKKLNRDFISFEIKKDIYDFSLRYSGLNNDY